MIRFFLIVFTRKYPIQRMLKKRKFRQNKLPTLRVGTIGLYCLYSFRFEYRYCLFLRKFFKRVIGRSRRKIRTYCRRRTWLFIRPNYTLTHKSKNARMGKGKGNFKRWCTIIYPGRIFIEHINVTPKSYLKYMRKIRIKLKLNLHYFHKSIFASKQNILYNCETTTNTAWKFVRIRRTLYTTQKKLISYTTQV